MHRRPAAVIVLAGVLGLAALLVAGYRSSRSDPVVRQTSIAFAEWPAGEPPRTVALISDIHMGGAMDRTRLDRIADQLNGLKPDLVLIAGDFVYGYKSKPAKAFALDLVEPLSRLKPPLGVVAVMGNHDHATAPAAIRDALAKAHVTVLENDSVRRGPITVMGFDDEFSGHVDLDRTVKAAAALPPGPRIALTHSPEVAPDLPAEATVLLAGHTHCGQVNLPLIGPLPSLIPGFHPYNWRYGCGLIHDPNRLVVVTAGLGTSSVPIRIGAPPDLWLLRLGPGAPGGEGH